MPVFIDGRAEFYGERVHDGLLPRAGTQGRQASFSVCSRTRTSTACCCSRAAPAGRACSIIWATGGVVHADEVSVLYVRGGRLTDEDHGLDCARSFPRGNVPVRHVPPFVSRNFPPFAGGRYEHKRCGGIQREFLHCRSGAGMALAWSWRLRAGADER